MEMTSMKISAFVCKDQLLPLHKKKKGKIIFLRNKTMRVRTVFFLIEVCDRQILKVNLYYNEIQSF